MCLNWNFQRGGGGGVQTKNSPWGGIWIFSGTTHYNKVSVHLNLNSRNSKFEQVLHSINLS